MANRASNGSGAFEKTSTGWRLRKTIKLPDGTRTRKSFTGKTQAACRHQYDAYMKQLAEPVAAVQAVTLAEWGDIWLESRKDSVVYGTWHNYELYWTKHIRPALGKNPVDKILPIQIEQVPTDQAAFERCIPPCNRRRTETDFQVCCQE